MIGGRGRCAQSVTLRTPVAVAALGHRIQLDTGGAAYGALRFVPHRSAVATWKLQPMGAACGTMRHVLQWSNMAVGHARMATCGGVSRADGVPTGGGQLGRVGHRWRNRHGGMETGGWLAAVSWDVSITTWQGSHWGIQTGCQLAAVSWGVSITTWQATGIGGRRRGANWRRSVGTSPSPHCSCVWPASLRGIALTYCIVRIGYPVSIAKGGLPGELAEPAGSRTASLIAGTNQYCRIGTHRGARSQTWSAPSVGRCVARRSHCLRHRRRRRRVRCLRYARQFRLSAGWIAAGHGRSCLRSIAPCCAVGRSHLEIEVKRGLGHDRHCVRCIATTPFGGDCSGQVQLG